MALHCTKTGELGDSSINQLWRMPLSVIRACKPQAKLFWCHTDDAGHAVERTWLLHKAKYRLASFQNLFLLGRCEAGRSMKSLHCESWETRKLGMAAFIHAKASRAFRSPTWLDLLLDNLLFSMNLSESQPNNGLNSFYYYFFKHSMPFQQQKKQTWRGICWSKVIPS